jgi:hypothetical protein
VACSPGTDQDGFATPAAVIVSLAIATIAIAVESRATAGLLHAQSDFRRASAEMALDGAATLAANQILSGMDQPPSFTLDGRRIQLALQPEFSKLGLPAAASLDLNSLAALGASQPARVQAGLARLARGDMEPGDVTVLDPSPRWRSCGRAFISPFGQATSVPGSPHVASPIQGHAGEVWRVEAISLDGWVDDRTVRLIGGAAQSARVLSRTFERHSPHGGFSCQLPQRAQADKRTATP